MFSDHLPLATLDIVSTGETGAWKSLSIKVQSRIVKFKDTTPYSSVPNAWCYIRHGSAQEHASLMETYLGPVINVRRGEPLQVSWINTLHSVPPMMPGDARALEFPPIKLHDMSDYAAIDPFKSMNYSIGIVTHLHGGKVQADSDGWPLAPVSFNANPFKLPSHRTYTYPNDQRATMLWFHDHGMDNTAPQVYAGLAGLYFIRDDSDDDLFQLIGDETQEIPLVIQDRLFNIEFTQADYASGILLDPKGTGFDRPEFLGDTIMVNGRPCPHAHVHPMIYRLRVLNGSNARTYALALVDPDAAIGYKAWYSDCLTVIGNDAGLFSVAEPLKNRQDYLLLAPGERLDLLLDLTKIDPKVENLQLVNLAVQGATDPTQSFEPIFQMDANSVVPPPAVYKGSALATQSRAQIMQFKLNPPEPGMPTQSLNLNALSAILAKYSNDEGFQWDKNTEKLTQIPSNAPIQSNRFILLMNNTAGFDGICCNTNAPWRDTQMWELITATNTPDTPTPFKVPFDAHLSSPSTPGVPLSIGKDYQVSRAFFLEPTDPIPPASDPLWGLATENSAMGDSPAVYKYPPLYQDNPSNDRPIIKPVEGSYERWYVANIGNDQPVLASAIPDMHPFHIHLVNFVVTNRYVLQLDPSTGKSIFVPLSRPLDFDGKVRHDTVRIQSNELVELLVYFPKGYKGRYPYHCHLVEHEDMGMMLNFEVQ